MSDSPFVWGEGGSKDTPAARRRRIAEAMMAKGMDASPIAHWTQGAARVAQALIGGWEARQADELERSARASLASEPALSISGGGTPVATAAASPVADPSAAVAATPAALAPVFTTKEAEYKLPTNYLPQVAKIESSFNPSAANPNSSARGLFQFTKGTARDYGLANPMDPIASTDAAARLAADNAKTLTNVLGRAPTAGELYLAHQQGGGGASKLLANPNARAIDVVGRDAVINNGGNANMTAAEFARRWTSKVAANEADLPAQDAAVAEAPGAAPGFAIPPAPAPAMDAATFNAIQSGQPLDPVFQSEGVSQPWMGTALAPAAPAAPQVAQAPMPPPRPADLPAPGAVEAIGQAPATAAPVAAATAPIIADPTKDNAGVLSGLVASEEARKGLPSGAGIMSLFGGASAAPAASPAAANDQSVFSRIASALGGGSAAPAPAAAPSPAVQTVAAATSASPATSAPPSAGVDRVASAMRVLNSPYATPGQRTVAQMVVQQAYRDPNEVKLKELQIKQGEKNLAKSDDPASIQEYNLAVKQGEKRSFTDWSTAKAKAGATNVNVDTKAENAEASARGAGIGKRLNDLAEDGAKAGEDAVLFQRFGDILNTVKTGKSTETLEKIRQATGLALDPNTDNVQALNAMIQYIGPRLRVPGSGAQSDRELGNFLASIPSLAGTPEGNKKILETMQGIIEHRRQRAGIASEWQLGDISAKEAQSRIDKLPSPFAKKEPEASAAAPDRAALEAEARRRGLIK